MNYEMHKALEYIEGHWDPKDNDYSIDDKSYWDLIDDSIEDKSAAREYVFDHLLEGSLAERCLAVEMAGQLCNPVNDEDDQDFEDKLASQLLTMTGADTPLSVLRNTTYVLRYLLASEEIIPVAYRLTYHADKYVHGFAAASFCSHLNDETRTAAFIDRLIELTRDEDQDVRDSTVTELTGQVEIYELPITSEIVQAFADRLDDEDDGIRFEAWRGLAACHDDRGLQPLLNFLHDPDYVMNTHFWTATLYARPELYPLLLGVKSWWQGDMTYLDEALAACKPKPE